jgi:hypothetical protein
MYHWKYDCLLFRLLVTAYSSKKADWSGKTILCEIRDSHVCDFEDYSLLGRDAI